MAILNNRKLRAKTNKLKFHDIFRSGSSRKKVTFMLLKLIEIITERVEIITEFLSPSNGERKINKLVCNSF